MAMKKMWLLCLIFMIVNYINASERSEKDMKYLFSKTYACRDASLYAAAFGGSHKQGQKETQQREHSKRDEEFAIAYQCSNYNTMMMSKAIERQREEKGQALQEDKETN